MKTAMAGSQEGLGIDSQQSRSLELKNELHTFFHDLKNFRPCGTLFMYGFPDHPCKNQWLDFEYALIGKSFNGIIKDLISLIVRGLAAVRYRVFHDGVAILRVYLLVHCSDNEYKLKQYSRFPNLDEKEYRLKVQSLINVMDFNKRSWYIGNCEQLLNYLIDHHVIIFDFKFAGLKGSTKWSIFNRTLEVDEFHIDRMIHGECYRDYIPEFDASSSSSSSPIKENKEERLLQIYNKISSPEFQLDRMSSFEKEIMNEVLNDEIPGFQSTLYAYQRRSVAKMYEKEIFSEKLIQKIYVKVNNDYYLNVENKRIYEKPEYFETPKGGILAENMGLGKTCITLALICITKFQISELPEGFKPNKISGMKSLLNNCVELITERAIPWRQYEDILPTSVTQSLLSNHVKFKITEAKMENYRLIQFEKERYLTSSTMIVVPDNLFNQWISEIKKHIKTNYLKVIEIRAVNSESPTLTKILDSDVVLVSIGAFKHKTHQGILKSVYWKRLVVDEGHSMSSNTSNSVQFASDLMAERRWIITGTPTDGLTGLHMEEDNNEYTIKKKFIARNDLKKLGVLWGSFFKMKPWIPNDSIGESKLWSSRVINPFLKNSKYASYEVEQHLRALLVRHSIKDVELDVKLPKLHHIPVYIKPSFFDTLSINLFIAVLAINTVTSERTDKDYMFHPSNKIHLQRLISNLQKAAFYWTGFSIQDIEGLLNIAQYAAGNKDKVYSEEDYKLLHNSIYIAKAALSNSRWRSACTLHEMSYFVGNLPKMFRQEYSISNYEKFDDYGNQIGVYGYPQLISIQKFFYRSRLIESEDILDESLMKESKPFWKNYWRAGTNKNSRSKVVLNSDFEKQEKIDLTALKYVEKLPKWADGFDPMQEEENNQKRHSSNEVDDNEGSTRKMKKKKAGQSNSNFRPSLKQAKSVQQMLRDGLLLGTASSKLSYLGSRLMENQTKKIKSIVFYEFENSAYYLTELLDILGVNYLMYSSYLNPRERSMNLITFDSFDVSLHGGTVLIMDLKLASHGLTILEATNVFFINPVWNKTIEAQAIKRSHRIGQTKEVFVETLILEKTIEEEMYKKRHSHSNDGDEQLEKNLIDNTGMQEYILRFEFLKMFDDFIDEYEPLRSKTTCNEDLKLGEYDDDGGIGIKSCTSKVVDNIRTWKVPLFSNENLNHISGVINNNKNHKKTNEMSEKKASVSTQQVLSKLKQR
ncbi:hypothetical protein CANARDRAFT_6906 [[Candida] arabinofermentans NRRL YB-2248]|uniref:Helicase C-terminal domain-containing protein n=1 Tax=[Candida] arabinofermentans NRRL YB-2248 TaxID=983967 RepID=A0A1E4T3X3_9ASCO|nr:hypothetical protein CANARDRAFT_6906 [[Candida] arabinofermentans NRRL YB-2248]